MSLWDGQSISASMRVKFALCSLIILVFIALLLGCGPRKDTLIAAPSDSVHLNRGKELVRGLAACGVCHATARDPEAPLAGGRETEDLYGPLKATNITPSKSGIGAWSDAQVLGALRGDWGEDQKYRSPFVHRGYEWISESDAYSIVGYLRTLAPMQNYVERREVSFIDRNTTGFFEGQRTVSGYVPEVDKKAPTRYGKYLVDHVARCGTCHSTPGTLIANEVYLGGAEFKGIDGPIFAPALVGGSETASYWNDSQIISYLKTGIRPDGSSVAGQSCPVDFYKYASNDDLFAVAQFLRSQS